jgi:diaminopimelate epimerase
MEAAGNDFIVIDNRRSVIKNPKAFAAKACRPHFGVGADGVLLIEPSKSADFFIRIFNSDGSEAEACGNGYRCVGLYAQKLLGFKKQVRAETLSGPVGIGLNSNSIRVKMAEPRDFRQAVEIKILHLSVKSGRNTLKASFINTGVPHTVIFTESLESISVEESGRKIRGHEQFKPLGTNVNFVEVTGPKSISIRTYERGVEAETLACGTGAAASAIVASLASRVKPPVNVNTKSGETLRVYFDRAGKTVKNVYLEGTARFVFEGKMRWDRP